MTPIEILKLSIIPFILFFLVAARTYYYVKVKGKNKPDVLTYILVYLALVWLVCTVVSTNAIVFFPLLASPIFSLFLFQVMLSSLEIKLEPLKLLVNTFESISVLALLTILATLLGYIPYPLDIIDETIDRLGEALTVSSYGIKIVYTIFISLPSIFSHFKRERASVEYAFTALYVLVESLVISSTTIHISTAIVLREIIRKIVDSLIDLIISTLNLIISLLMLPKIDRVTLIAPYPVYSYRSIRKYLSVIASAFSVTKIIFLIQIVKII